MYIHYFSWDIAPVIKIVTRDVKPHMEICHMATVLGGEWFGFFVQS